MGDQQAFIEEHSTAKDKKRIDKELRDMVRMMK